MKDREIFIYPSFFTSSELSFKSKKFFLQFLVVILPGGSAFFLRIRIQVVKMLWIQRIQILHAGLN